MIRFISIGTYETFEAVSRLYESPMQFCKGLFFIYFNIRNTNYKTTQVQKSDKNKH